MNELTFFITWMAVLVNVLILVSSLDDFFIDFYYWIRLACRAITIRRKYPPLSIEALSSKTEAPFAIMIPAWREFSVIANMVENTISTLTYDKYFIFVGTYRNDPETCSEVKRLERRYKRVKRVEVPHDGPTCKADCLNWIIRAIFEYEAHTGISFSGVVMHDSEDILHPLELRLFNYLVDRKDLIQLPVLSLERKWSEWVAGTYQDDFAEWHSKDLVVRESLTGIVPCAGVAACYSRKAIAALCEGTENQPFNTGTLTEDYDFSFRLKDLGMEEIFVRFPIGYMARATKIFGGTKETIRQSFIAVREYFPHQFQAAYRQRARWLLGIGLQGWQILGWRGPLINKYLLYRDRKGLVTSFVNILAYILFLLAGGFILVDWMGLGSVRLSAAVAPGRWFTILMSINLFFMLNRIFQRIFFVSRLFGFMQGLLSIPRIIVNNFLNFASALRAWHLFIVHLVTGKKLTWDKTVHSFPTYAELLPFKKKLGEILHEWEILGKERLEVALKEQLSRPKPLGQILLEHRWVDEDLLADAIAYQAQLPRSSVNSATLESNRNQLPLHMVTRYSLVPLGLGENGEELIGVSTPPTLEAKRALEAHFVMAPKFFIITGSQCVSAIAFLRAGEVSNGPLVLSPGVPDG